MSKFGKVWYPNLGKYHCRQRPYRDEYTGSLPNSEVNRHRARSVVNWGTVRENLRVPLAFLLHLPCPRAWLGGAPRSLAAHLYGVGLGVHFGAFLAVFSRRPPAGQGRGIFRRFFAEFMPELTACRAAILRGLERRSREAFFRHFSPQTQTFSLKNCRMLGSRVAPKKELKFSRKRGPLKMPISFSVGLLRSVPRMRNTGRRV